MSTENVTTKQPAIKALVAGMVFAAAVAAGNANATGMPVLDISNLLQNLMNQINTYSARFQDVAEYGQTATRWTSTLNHYRQQLVQIQGIMSNIGLPQGQSITKVDADYLVAERCNGGQGGFSFASLTQQFSLNPSGDLIQQQRQICANIQRMQNAKFNYTVDFFKDYAPKLQDELTQLGSQRNASNDQGNVAASDNDALRVSNDVDVKFQTWQATLHAYDSYIVSMEENQRVLAKVALKGREGPLGTLVKTATLKAALEVGD